VGERGRADENNKRKTKKSYGKKSFSFLDMGSCGCTLDVHL
jgi:hypothetical protein